MTLIDHSTNCIKFKQSPRKENGKMWVLMCRGKALVPFYNHCRFQKNLISKPKENNYNREFSKKPGVFVSRELLGDTN